MLHREFCIQKIVIKCIRVMSCCNRVPGAWLLQTYMQIGFARAWTAKLLPVKGKIMSQDMDAAGRLAALREELAAQGLDGFIVTERYLLHRQGLFPNEVHRGPLGYQLDEATRAEIDRIYALLQETLARA